MRSGPEAGDLERYLRKSIPLSAAMDVRVREATRNRVTLAAPLEPNINHRETAFGGSSASLAVLAAWALLHLRLEAEVPASRLVIHRSEMRYMHAIPGDFTAVCELADEAAWERFRAMLERRGRARIELSAVVMHGARTCATFQGEFVAVRS